MSGPLLVSSARNIQAKHKHVSLICRGQRGKAGEFTRSENLGGKGERKATERVEEDRKSVREQEPLKGRGE